MKQVDRPPVVAAVVQAICGAALLGPGFSLEDASFRDDHLHRRIVVREGPACWSLFSGCKCRFPLCSLPASVGGALVRARVCRRPCVFGCWPLEFGLRCAWSEKKHVFARPSTHLRLGGTRHQHPAEVLAQARRLRPLKPSAAPPASRSWAAPKTPFYKTPLYIQWCIWRGPVI